MFETLLEKLSCALDQVGIPYMVIGGQAVLRHGEPRLTKDIDLTLGRSLQGARVTWRMRESWQPRIQRWMLPTSRDGWPSSRRLLQRRY